MDDVPIKYIISKPLQDKYRYITDRKNLRFLFTPGTHRLNMWHLAILAACMDVVLDVEHPFETMTNISKSISSVSEKNMAYANIVIKAMM